MGALREFQLSTSRQCLFTAEIHRVQIAGLIAVDRYLRWFRIARTKT